MQQGQLDADLLVHGEDSIILLFRPAGNEPWLEYPYYQKNTLGSSSNGYGRMELSKVMAGEYVFANGVSNLSIQGKEKPQFKAFKIFPNPADDSLNLKLRASDNRILSYRIFSTDGRLVSQGTWSVQKGDNEKILSTSTLKAGTYVINLEGQSVTFSIIHD